MTIHTQKHTGRKINIAIKDVKDEANRSKLNSAINNLMIIVQIFATFMSYIF
jgi:hypothetical protein